MLCCVQTWIELAAGRQSSGCGSTGGASPWRLKRCWRPRKRDHDPADMDVSVALQHHTWLLFG